MRFNRIAAKIIVSLFSISLTLNVSARTASIEDSTQIATLSQNSYPFREWKSRSSPTAIQARLLSLTEGSVSFERDDGKIFKIDIAKLSDADQEYLKSPKPLGPRAVLRMIKGEGCDVEVDVDQAVAMEGTLWGASQFLPQDSASSIELYIVQQGMPARKFTIEANSGEVLDIDLSKPNERLIIGRSRGELTVDELAAYRSHAYGWSMMNHYGHPRTFKFTPVPEPPSMLNVFMTQKLAEMIVFEAEEVMGNNWTDKKLIETADSSSAMIREGIRNLRNFNTSPSFLELNTFAASELIKFSAKNAVYEKLYALSKHVRRSGWSNAAPFFLAISGVPVAKSPFSLEVTPLGNDISFSLKNVSGVDMNNVTILFESKFSELGPELESRQFFCFYDQFEANHDQAFGRQPLMHLLGNGRMPEIKECFVVSVWCDELSSVRNSFDSVAEKRKNKDFPFIPPPTNLRPSKTKAARGKTTAATGSLNRQLILNSSTR